MISTRGASRGDESPDKVTLDISECVNGQIMKVFHRTSILELKRLCLFLLSVVRVLTLDLQHFGGLLRCLH